MSSRQIKTFASVLLISILLFGAAWYLKAASFKAPAQVLTVELIEPAAPALDNLFVIARPISESALPYHIRTTVQAWFPWRHLHPWNRFSRGIIKSTQHGAVWHEPDEDWKARLETHIDTSLYALCCSPEFNAARLIDYRRGRTVHLFGHYPQQITPPNPEVFNNRNHVFLTLNRQSFVPDLPKAPAPTRYPPEPVQVQGSRHKLVWVEYEGDLVVVDLNTLSATKLVEKAVLKHAASRSDKFVYTVPTAWGREGYLGSLTARPVKIWNDSLTRYEARISSNGEMVAFITAMGESWGGFNVEIYNTTTGTTTMFPKNYHETKMPFSREPISFLNYSATMVTIVGGSSPSRTIRVPQ